MATPIFVSTGGTASTLTPINGSGTSIFSIGGTGTLDSTTDIDSSIDNVSATSPETVNFDSGGAINGGAGTGFGGSVPNPVDFASTSVTGGAAGDFDDTLTGDTVAGAGTGDTVNGATSGADLFLGGRVDGETYSGLDGRDDIRGSGAGDILYGNRQEDTIAGGNGRDTIFGGQDGDSVSGNLGADVLYGNRGSDALYGGLGNDVLVGGQGSDTLVGAQGGDTLTGGLGADLFVFREGDGGADLVTDFSAEDRIEIASSLLDGGLISNAIQYIDGNTVLHLGTVDITLSGVELEAGDFTLV